MKKISIIISLMLSFVIMLTACTQASTYPDKSVPENVESAVSDKENDESSLQSEDTEITESTDDISVTEESAAEASQTAANIIPADWENIKWTQYSSPYFTLDIPEGWKVDWNGNAERLYWTVGTEDGDIGLENQDHVYAAKDPSIMQITGVEICLSEGTVPEFFDAVVGSKQDTFEVKNSCVPANKEILQSIRPTTPIRDYQSLYVNYTNNGFEGEGIYSAVIMESRDVVYSGMNYGMWEINCVYTEHTPLGELVNWQPVLTKIAQSFKYTQQYIMEWQQTAGSNETPESPVSDTDPVMQAFEERSKQDTIIQEKRSDMIGEYERVVDNDTGDIYRAYNGFLDDIGTEQKKYTAITDEQYLEGYKGWIDK